MWDARTMTTEADGSPRLRVAFDGTPLLGTRTGIGVATAEMLGALAARGDLELDVFAVSLRHRSGLRETVPEGVSTKQRPMAARPLSWLWARSSHPRLERFVPPVDVVHGSNFVVPPTRRAGRVVSVWDLTFVRYPELCQPATLRYERLLARAIRAGALVHTPSQAIAEEVRQHFRARREQVCSVPLGVPELGEADPGAAARIVDPATPYILSIGTAEPRKDLPSLVAAFDLLAVEQPELELLLVGPPGWGEEDLNSAISVAAARSRIRRTGYVEAGCLATLLSDARALAYPSLYEGFGFPPLQAMAAGVPVVTTRAGALSEVVGGAALIVEPGEIEDLAAALEVAVSDEAQRSVMITAGRIRAADFSWEKTAAGLRALYARAADR
jgi:glycosyltransferase involved in cell wall biosynthesis